MSTRPATRRRGGEHLGWWGAAVVAALLVVWMLSRGVIVQDPRGIVSPLLLLAAPLLWVRRHSLGVVLALLAGFACLTLLGFAGQAALLGFVSLDAAVFITALRGPRRESVAAAAAAVVVPGLVWFGEPYRGPNGAAQLALALTVAVAWAAGNSVHQRRSYAAQLQARETAQAVTAERLRIARELHDMVAHSMGIIAIQSGVGARVIDSQPDEARGALSAIEGASRDTLAGLRRMLVALREPESEPKQLTASAPGIADIDRLAQSTADLGLRVDVQRSGQPRALPPEIDLAAFRIVQESVTNVLRHARAARCRVDIGFLERALSVRVTDDGCAASVGAAGFGIVGMRERVHLLGGEFHAGPRDGGGFEVSAVLPT